MKILLIEDDPEDVELALEVLEETKLKLDMSVARDGEQALDYLHKRGDHANAVRPDLILLDLNLPVKDGREFLRELKADGKLKTIPVVVLSSSDAEKDILQAYAEGASCYLTKPVGLKEFTKVVQSIEDFWFTVVKFPPRDSNE